MRSATRSGTGRLERAIARVLILAMIGMTPGQAFAGEEFGDADNVVLETAGSIDNSVAGQTTIDSLSETGLARWTTGLDQGADNTLNILQPSDTSTFTNQVDGNFTAHLNGTLLSNGNVVIASPFGVFFGADAVVDVGSLLAVGGSLTDPSLGNAPNLDLSGRVENHGSISADRNVLFYGSQIANHGRISAGTGEILMLGGDSVHFLDSDVDSIVSRLLDPVDYVALLGAGSVENHGLLQSRDATLIGSRVANYGEIEIDDGSLMMLGADAVYVRRFDNPVLVRLPHDAAPTSGEEPRYAVENHGQIRAGLGHVRLAASDPLGWGIRQGSGTPERPAEIEAASVEIDGGDEGRVALSGEIDASNSEEDETGGRIDISGDLITLVDANIHASGDAGGGHIQIGGEQQGGGELQRATALIVDETSQVRADAIRDGDGGRVILFSEDTTFIAGEISARGGEEGGDGGFIETSGLRNFNITLAPDASAPAGQAGDWLIDPYTIRIVDEIDAPDCSVAGASSCIARAIEAVLAPNFDDAAFADIFRTVDPGPTGEPLNDISVELLVRALAVGTNVTLSTESFDPDGVDPAELDGNGDIIVDAAIEITDDGTLKGTRATLTLLAAGNIQLNDGADITVRGPTASPTPTTPDFQLSLVLRANDQSQRGANEDFGADQLAGSVTIDSDIRTGGGDVTASGISVTQTSTSEIHTDGGDVIFLSGSLNNQQSPANFARDNSGGAIPTASSNPGVSVDGLIDTRSPLDNPVDGGVIILAGNGVGIATSQAGNDPLHLDPGQLTVTGELRSGGGEIALSAGFLGASGNISAGNVSVDGATIASDGGDIVVAATRIDAEGDHGRFDIEFVEAGRGQGGSVSIGNGANFSTTGGTLRIGSPETQNISIDGTFSTLGGAATGSASSEDGLIVLVAGDADVVDISEERFGRSTITIGANEETSLTSAGIYIEAREVTSSVAGSSHDVTLTASGETSALVDAAELGLAAAGDEDEVVSLIEANELGIVAGRVMTLNERTTLTAREIRLNAAAIPDQLNGADVDAVGNALADEHLATTTTNLRLVFGGVGGAGDGVRLNADEISIEIGDGTTATDDLAFEAVDDGTGPGAELTEFGFLRGSRGDYDGLQLRDATGAFRPEVLSIRQDGDLTVEDAAGTSQLFLGERSDIAGANTTGAFGDAHIGTNGQEISLESSDGILEIQDAAGLSSDSLVVPDADGGRSWVTLAGGLLLPDSAGETLPSSEAVLFTGTFLGDSAFNVEGLSVSTPRTLAITTNIADAIASVADLEFRAGRLTGVEDAAQDGQLTIEAGVALQAADRLALHGGANGFGDLTFAAGGATQIQANRIELRAGGGAESENSTAATRSKIDGLIGAANVELRDAAGQSFQSRGATELSFSYRQDAEIDSDADLPDFDQFGITDPPGTASFDGPGASAPVVYSVRSDAGAIDFRGDALGGDRFNDATLSLVGLRTSVAAILVDPDFRFTGPEIELGGVTNFTYTQLLADAFNPADGTNTLLRLRAAMNGSGTLRFESGVVVKAGRIDLVASEGTGGDGTGRVSRTGALFDLAEAAPGERTLLFQVDEDLQPSDLPTTSQFVDGNLPNILALRNDNGLINIANLDIAALPLELEDDLNPGRLILEAEAIRLTRSGGNDLELTRSSEDEANAGIGELRNIRLRLRANSLDLSAIGSSSSQTGRVLLGFRPGDSTTPITGADALFDDESLLIEAFDADADLATTDNLSRLSETAEDSGLFDLAIGRGPTTIEIEQDGAITPSELPQRNAVSGNFARTLEDDVNGDDIAAFYSLFSDHNSITVDPNSVSGSNLTLGTTAVFTPFEEDITFQLSGVDGAFDLEGLSARTTGSVFVKDGVQITSADSITMSAAEFATQPTTAFDADNPMGTLDFEAGPNGITLEANRIQLSAAPIILLTNRDGTTDEPRDGERDEIEDEFLGFINFAGLSSVLPGAATEDSTFAALQARSFDVTNADIATTGVDGDVVRALIAGTSGADEWSRVELASTQGALTVNQIEGLGQATRNLGLGRIGLGASVILESTLADPFGDPAGPDGFEGTVRIESNDILIRALFAAGDFVLDSANLSLVNNTFLSGFEDPNDLGQLASNSDDLERPVLRIEQPGNFESVSLPRLDRYFRIPSIFENIDEDETPRDSLGGLDLELTTTGNEFILGDNVREGATGSNLIVRAPSDADVRIRLTSRTPGFTDYDFDAEDVTDADFAALQLNSLEISNSDETPSDEIRITVEDFLTPTDDLTVATFGDQLWGGRTILNDTLSTSGRDIRFSADVHSDGVTDLAGLVVASTGEVTFEADVGATDEGTQTDEEERLAELFVIFDDDSTSGTPAVQFGRRTDEDDDDVFETAVASDQQVIVNDGNIVFLSAALNEADDPSNPDDLDLIDDLRNDLDGLGTLQEIADVLDTYDVGRVDNAPFATVGKSSGDLSFQTVGGGNFIMGSGERLADGGLLTIDVATGVVTLGDVAAIDLVVGANEIGLVKRNAGVSIDISGSTSQDRGSSILANTIDFGGVTPEVIGSGKDPRFGLQNPSAPGLDSFLGGFSRFANLPNGGPLDAAFFSFAGGGAGLADQVPSLLPRGASRSDLTGAFGPDEIPQPDPVIPEQPRLAHPDLLPQLGVEPVETSNEVVVARLMNVAIINDLEHDMDDRDIPVTETRLDARDAEKAIALYEELFGADGEGAGEVRATLQEALDTYLETTRARRVIGFELRRFVKNRPSSLLEAYTTLDELDALFRYHRRLGLSPGEFRRIQRRWLAEIRPDGITLDELSEAIHPSRYVRGSDILDIFGR